MIILEMLGYALLFCVLPAFYVVSFAMVFVSDNRARRRASARKELTPEYHKFYSVDRPRSFYVWYFIWGFMTFCGLIPLIGMGIAYALEMSPVLFIMIPAILGFALVIAGTRLFKVEEESFTVDYSGVKTTYKDGRVIVHPLHGYCGYTLQGRQSVNALYFRDAEGKNEPMYLTFLYYGDVRRAAQDVESLAKTGCFAEQK